MPQYRELPTKDGWKADLGLTGFFFGNKKSPFPALQRIGALMDMYHGSKEPRARMFICIDILRHAKFILKCATKDVSKLGGTPTEQQINALKELQNYLESRLLLQLQAKDSRDLQEKMLFETGRSVAEHEAVEDREKANDIRWYEGKGELLKLKLSFRNGQVCKYNFIGDNKAELLIYDTVDFNDDIEFGGSLYVMDTGGRIYVSGETGEKSLKHSSFLKGDMTLAAGHLRVEKGSLKWVSASSGHYKPTVKQMVNLLERLRSYAVNLKGVQVKRHNHSTAAQGRVDRYGFETCSAEDMLKARAWPGDNANPQTMFIPSDK